MLGEAIAKHNGAIVKTIGDAVMATFPTGGDALAAGLAIQRAIRRLDLRGEADAASLVRVGMHQGPCVAVTANDRLDYFGTTVNIASRVEHEARGGEVAATAERVRGPDAQAVLAGAKVRAEMTMARLKGIDEPVRLYRLRLRLERSPLHRRERLTDRLTSFAEAVAAAVERARAGRTARRPERSRRRPARSGPDRRRVAR